MPTLLLFFLEDFDFFDFFGFAKLLAASSPPSASCHTVSMHLQQRSTYNKFINALPVSCILYALPACTASNNCTDWQVMAGPIVF